MVLIITHWNCIYLLNKQNLITVKEKIKKLFGTLLKKSSVFVYICAGDWLPNNHHVKKIGTDWI